MSGNPAELLQRGNTFIQSGHLDEALAVYEDILAAAPDHLDALNNRGIILAQLKKYKDALRTFDRAIDLRPNFPEALRNRGTLLWELGRNLDALKDHESALRLRPEYREAHYGRGVALINLGRVDEALTSLEEALRIQPTYPEALYARAAALAKAERLEESLVAFERAFAVAPPTPALLNEHGCVLLGLRRFEDALANFERALELRPDFSVALNNRGFVLRILRRYEEALASFERVLEIRPDFVEALDNRGLVLAELGHFQEALASADEALKIRPDFAPAQLQVGVMCLRMGDFGRGLRHYEWRWIDKAQGLIRREHLPPLWTGSKSLKGKTILVHSEQGLGDAIQFVRYAPLLAQRGGTVLLEVPSVLVPLMHGLKGVSHTFARSETTPSADFHCPLLSLPLAFGTTLETIPASIPYLSVDRDASLQWRQKLAHGADKLVGICWRGNPNYSGDAERSIPLADFVSLLKVPGIKFVSLLKDLTNDERNVAKNFSLLNPAASLESTAALVASLDLVVSVDTVWPHWAGAIGKPFWVLLSRLPHWIWLLERNDSPWYPTGRLFRQSESRDWQSVLRIVAKELIDWRRIN